MRQVRARYTEEEACDACKPLTQAHCRVEINGKVKLRLCEQHAADLHKETMPWKRPDPKHRLDQDTKVE